MAIFPEFLKAVCQQWRLPFATLTAPFDRQADVEKTNSGGVRPQPDAPLTKRLRSKFRSIDDIPSRHGIGCPRILRGGHSQRFTFIVDCQPLSQTFHGKEPLHQNCLAPVFERMTNRMFGMLRHGWCPNVLSADRVSWHRRERNEIADFIVNHTMERAEDWQLTLSAHFRDFNVQQANLQISYAILTAERGLGLARLLDGLWKPALCSAKFNTHFLLPWRGGSSGILPHPSQQRFQHSAKLWNLFPNWYLTQFPLNFKFHV